MRYLLDTLSFIWLDSEPNRLSPAAATLIADKTHTIMLSFVSVLEMQIKINVGKMSLSLPLAQRVQQHLDMNQTTLLPITLGHIYQLSELPLYHNDPFDRLLIAQAIEEGVPILSRDPQFSNYLVTVIW